MTRLSVNINKVATIRNARGGNVPDLLQVAKDCEKFGAEGITVHPRPDERHIRYNDVRLLKPVVNTEFNIEGNPIPSFIKLVDQVLPDQVTLVPDSPDALTSNAGWDCIKNRAFLTEIVSHLRSLGIRSSIFLDPDLSQVEAAAITGVDRIELYTESYAKQFAIDRLNAVSSFSAASELANEIGLGVNAGHDLDLENLSFFKENVSNVKEVSIGHALISDALYYGLEKTIKLYLNELAK